MKLEVATLTVALDANVTQAIFVTDSQSALCKVQNNHMWHDWELNFSFPAYGVLHGYITQVMLECALTDEWVGWLQYHP